MFSIIIKFLYIIDTYVIVHSFGKGQQFYSQTIGLEKQMFPHHLVPEDDKKQNKKNFV